MLASRPPEAATAQGGAGAATKWAEVDVGALRDNVATLCRRAGAGVAVMAMVKANGYGHGAVLAARAALAGGAGWLGVSCAEEALQLREAGLETPLLLTGWGHPRLLAALIAAEVDVTVFDADSLAATVAAAARARRPARVQVKLDTGMTRLGCREEDLDGLLSDLAAARSRLRVTGVFSHLADAEADDDFTSAQHDRFLRLAPRVAALGSDVLLHCANSAATLRRPDTHHDLVRPGIAVYGYPPSGCDGAGLRPAMTVLAHVSQVRTVRPGDSVGYGRTWRATAAARVATVAAGYGDGVFRALGNRGEVLLRGQRCPIVGRVSMDQITVDASAAGEVRAGDAAVLFGERDGARLDAAEVAAMIGTIPHEVLCAVTARVPRVAVGVGDLPPQRGD